MVGKKHGFMASIIPACIVLLGAAACAGNWSTTDSDVENDGTDLDWIFDNGEKQQVNTHDVVIQEASHPDAIYFILEGVVGIFSKSAGDRQIAVLGPGEIIGEMSFLMNCRATASVVALENVLLLALSRQKLQSKLEQDLDFAASLYKSFAIVESRRLREGVGTFGSIHKKAIYSKEIRCCF